MANVRSRELGAYLRARRDRLSPEEVGLPGGGGRRRVNGLRREEVAVLANVGSTWYTWLEQGRDVQPSLEVLIGIAGALRLSKDERRHLLLLGGHPGTEAEPRYDRVGDRVQELLDQLAPSPAVVMKPWFEPVAYNASFRFMINDLEALPEPDRNCAYLNFTHPDWIAGHADHEQECAAIVAALRASQGESVTDPAWSPLLTRLRAESPLFARLWGRADVATDAPRTKHVLSAHVGRLTFRPITMLLQDSPHTRMVVYQPDDHTTRQRLADLTHRIAAGHIDGPATARRPRPMS